MANPFENAANAAAKATKAIFGSTVTYSRGSGSVTLTARAASTRATVADEQGFEFGTVIRDWIIDVADLVIATVAITPRRGDTIAVTAAGKIYTYEVLPVGGEETHRFTDSSSNRWRIHTKLKSSEDA